MRKTRQKTMSLYQLIHKNSTYNSLGITLDKNYGISYIVDNFLKEFEGKSDQE